MITVVCPNCFKSSSAPDDFVGKRVKCKPCGKAFTAIVAHCAVTADMPAKLTGPVHDAPLPVVQVGTKPCPFCAETIQAAALKCRHCSEFLDPALRASVVSRQAEPEPTPFRRYDDPVERKSAHQTQIISQAVVVNTGQEYQVPHLIHLLATLCTAGLWLPMWIIHSLINSSPGRRQANTAFTVVVVIGISLAICVFLTSRH